MTETQFELETTLIDLVTIAAASKLPNPAPPELAAAMQRIRHLAQQLGLPARSMRPAEGEETI